MKKINMIFLSAIFLLSVFISGCATGEATTEKTGKLEVTSEPSDADIYIGNVFKGKTPAEFKLNQGWYNVRIQKRGYQNYEQKIKISVGKKAAVNGILSRINRPAPNVNATQPAPQPSNTLPDLVIDTFTIDRVFVNTSDSSTLVGYSLTMKNIGGGTIDGQHWIAVEDNKGIKKYHSVYGWNGRTPYSTTGSFTCASGTTVTLRATADGFRNVIQESDENNNQRTVEGVCTISA